MINYNYRLLNRHKLILEKLGAYNDFVEEIRNQKLTVTAAMLDTSQYDGNQIRSVLGSFKWAKSIKGYYYWNTVYDMATQLELNGYGCNTD